MKIDILLMGMILLFEEQIREDYARSKEEPCAHIISTLRRGVEFHPGTRK